MSEKETSKRTLRGQVVSDKMEKTAVVRIDRRVRHPLYGKYLTRSTKLHVHDESNECSVGDFVEIAEARPLSKKKSWSLVRIVERAS